MKLVPSSTGTARRWTTTKSTSVAKPPERRRKVTIPRADIGFLFASTMWGNCGRGCSRFSDTLGRASTRMIEGPAPVSSVGVISRIRASSKPRAAGIVYCRYTGAKTRCTRIFEPCALGPARGDRAASGTPRARFPIRERQMGPPSGPCPLAGPREHRRRARLR